jgi:glycosyltransferase involved in cell wall biosynthesis
MAEVKHRFLFVTADEFPTYRPDVEILFGKELLGRGHRIDWIASGPTGEDGIVETRWRGCRAWLAPVRSGAGVFGSLRNHLRALRNELRILPLARREHYDFVQVKDCYLAALVGLLAARLSGTPFFYWHSFPFPEASLEQATVPGSRHPLLYRLRGRVLHLLLYRIICPAADHVFVQSDEMLRQMARSGIDPGKMTAVPMGVDEQVLDAAGPGCRSAGRGDRKGPTIVYLGALDRLRRLDFLIHVFAAVAARHPDARLCLVGDGHDPADVDLLRETARACGVEDRLEITGFLPRERALEHVAAASVCVSPLPPGPVYEVSSPTKVLEYLALGRPVVANHIPDSRTVLTESGGGVSVPYEVEAFAEAVCHLLTDRQRADCMGRRGREYVREHRTYRVLADALERRYADLLTRRQCNGRALT